MSSEALTEVIFMWAVATCMVSIAAILVAIAAAVIYALWEER